MNIEKLKQSVWKYNNSKYHIETSESGLHSNLYLNTDYIIQNPKLVEEIVKEVFVKELKLRKINPNWIITYPPFGLPIAFELAKQTNSKFGYVDTKKGICNFNVKENDIVIVVGDDIYSGGSLKKTINIMKDNNVKVKSPIFTIGNFSNTNPLLGLEVISVISEKGNLYAKEDCPMCKNGSRAVLPRPNWKKLIHE
jgi:orotate phosphoribosyltransferase